MKEEARSQKPEAKPSAPAKSFEQLIVWQKAHQLVLAKDLNYGDATRLQPQLEEVGKLLEAYAAKILDSGF